MIVQNFGEAFAAFGLEQQFWFVADAAMAYSSYKFLSWYKNGGRARMR